MLKMNQLFKNFASGVRNVVKNIASEIVRECAKQGVTLNVDVASLGVLLIALNPDHGIPLSTQNDRSLLENFVRYCEKIFLDERSPLVKTLEMQVCFMSNSIDLNRVLKKYQANIEEKTQPLLKDIIDIENPNKDELERLFKKIMVYINMTYLLGSPMNQTVLTETSHALKSVISRADLADFFVLTKKARMKQLITIQQVVCGIRIFNKDAGHCGEGIRNIQSDLQFAYENTKIALLDKLENINAQVERLTKFMHGICDVNTEEDTIKLQLTALVEGFTELDFCYLKDMLILKLQHEFYVRRLMSHLTEVKADIDDYLDEFRKELDVLHDIVQFRTAVPTEKVFPHFTQVSILWQSLLNCIYLLIEINKVNESMSLQVYFRKSDKIMRKFDKIIRSHKETTISVQALINVMNKSDLQYVGPMSQENTTVPPISKFCPYIFIAGKGLLYPTKTSAGFLKHNDILFSFYSSECAKKFLSNVEYYYSQFMNTLRSHPQLLIFFDTYELASTFASTEVKTKAIEVIKTHSDSIIQTELHPIPYNKDKNYTWNIWDLRRRAIKLANLKKCRTQSAQTQISFHRMSVNLQTANPKENSCQTKCDASTNIAKKDARTDCTEEENLIGVKAMAVSGIRHSAPLTDYCTVPYRTYPNKK